MVCYAMETDRIVKLLEANNKLVAEHLRTTEKVIDEMAKKRVEIFTCNKCGKWKRRRITESTMEPNSDDGRDLACAYNSPGIEV